jgi:hypothetical protein
VPETPYYLVVGRGRWASLIHRVLQSERRQVAVFGETRIGVGESVGEYQTRLAQAMESSGASVAWLCLPFGSWIPTMSAAAMSSGLDVIAECPWLCTPEVTESLMSLEKKQGRILSVHYEYCMLDEIGAWCKEFRNGSGCRFNGIFKINRPGRHGSVASLQLGSHLLSMWRFGVPEATLGEIQCSYESADERTVWLSRGEVTVSRIDFLANTQPLIQRFIYAFEEGFHRRKAIFGLEFAKRIATEVRGLV